MSDSTDLSAVEALLQERDALRGWLDRLDQSTASVPESVRARVREDYQSRLDGMVERLRQHADTVATRLIEDQAERDRLSTKARAAREALAEAELRHAVGEYDAVRFDGERSRYVAELEEHETALNTLNERIAGLEDVHFAVTRAPVAESPPEREDATFEIGASEDQPVATFVPEAVPIEDLAPTGEASDDDDDLLSIFDAAGEAGDAEPESPPLESEVGEHPPVLNDPPAATRPPGFGPLSFTPTGETSEMGGPARPAVPGGSQPLGMPGIDQSPRFVRPAPERGSELVELPAERGERFRVVPDPEPVLPEAASAEAPEPNARTLRCGECGAMNRPLEWYCEKCGAELTAV